MLFQQILIVSLTSVAGGVAGYFNKCRSGVCPLTATWWRGALYGAAVGLVAVSAY